MMSTVATIALTPNGKRHASFVAFILISSLAFYKTLSALVKYSLHNESSSHIVLIPWVAFFLLYLERQTVFSITRTNIGCGDRPGAGGDDSLLAGESKSFSTSGNWPLCLETFAVILVWIGGFLLCYGFVAFRAGAFPLLFLLLMVPIPDVVLDRVIHALQEGSTEDCVSHFPGAGNSCFAARVPAFRAGCHD